jgi:3-methyladenine DNA glycosylase AlkD
MKDKIVSDLFNMRDEKFAKFNSGLIPTTDSEYVIGIRTPELKQYAKTLSNPDEFLNDLPHKYFEENQLHAFILSGVRDFDFVINELERFLPYIDNWAVPLK